MGIKELRKLTGLSQSKFATKDHLNLYTLQQWERGRFDPPEAIQHLLGRIIQELDYKSLE